MKVYYKAVRPDGTDFATGTTLPVVGEWMPRIEGKLVLCARGYHVSDEPGETLIGGSWPCRLFEVEIDEVVPYGNVDGHKSVVPTYRPIRELPAWMALGPNGEKVAAIIERVRVLTPDEQRALLRAQYGGPARDAVSDPASDAVSDAVRYAAWDAAWYAASDAVKYAARDAARDAASNAAWYAARDAAWYAASDAARDAARDAAWYAASDATLATITRDLITQEQFNTLYEPWRRVIDNA